MYLTLTPIYLCLWSHQVLFICYHPTHLAEAYGVVHPTESQLLRSQLHLLLYVMLDKGILSLQLSALVHNVDNGSSHHPVLLSLGYLCHAGIPFTHGCRGHSTTLDEVVAIPALVQFQHFSADVGR